MKLSKRFNTCIKLTIIVLFLAGLIAFKLIRSNISAAFAASLHIPQTKVVSSNCGSWSVVASPNFGTKPNYLSAIAAVSANDVWTVGTYGGSSTRTLIEHWNGKTWSIIPRPAISQSSLSGLAAIAANDVWTVGTMLNSSYQSLIEHWNGTSWSIVPSPNTLAEDFLVNIAAVSANDIWAIGKAQDTSGIDHPLFEHWDGTQWSIVASPSIGSSSNDVNSIAAVTSNDVWAVGSFKTSPTGTGQTLVEHWDGMQWSIVASPNVGTFGSGLNGATVVSVHNIWAVGSYTINGSLGTAQTLVEHWDGIKWSVVSSPNVGANTNDLTAVKAISSKNIWAVGSTSVSSNPPQPTQTLIEHWDGTQWSVVASPSPADIYNFLDGITRVPGTGQLWASGYILSSSAGHQTLTEFYC